MAGVNVDAGGRGGRRALDSEINMIPMIDLLMVTISFLLITAVWSHMSRMNANAQVPGPPTDSPVTAEPRAKQLHIEMRPEGRFALLWKEGPTVVSSSEVARNEVVTMEGAVRVVRYPELAAKVAAEWSTVGAHRDASDRRFDQAILHTDNETPYASLVGVMDAVEQVHRPIELGKKVESVPAFNLTFAVN
jgi:biopolymer transport protein ExbD